MDSNNDSHPDNATWKIVTSRRNRNIESGLTSNFRDCHIDHDNNYFTRSYATAVRGISYPANPNVLPRPNIISSTDNHSHMDTRVSRGSTSYYRATYEHSNCEGHRSSGNTSNNTNSISGGGSGSSNCHHMESTMVQPYLRKGTTNQPGGSTSQDFFRSYSTAVRDTTLVPHSSYDSRYERGLTTSAYYQTNSSVLRGSTSSSSSRSVHRNRHDTRSAGNSSYNTHRSSVRSFQTPSQIYYKSKMVKPCHRDVSNNQSRGSTLQASYRRSEISSNVVQPHDRVSASLINHPSQQQGLQVNNSAQYYMLDVDETTQICVTLHDDIRMPTTVFTQVLHSDFRGMF